MPIKWDDKAERDFLLAMRIVEHGFRPVTGGTWKKACEVMQIMGYQDVTSNGISQRWAKILLKNFQTQYPQVFEADGGIASTAALMSADGGPIAASPVRKRQRRKRKRPSKDEETEEEEDDIKQARLMIKKEDESEDGVIIDDDDDDNDPAGKRAII